jgi:hypothetical protein
MTPELTCFRCSRVISSEDTVERYGYRVAHVDCRQPRRLSREERSLLYQYCWDHAVGECGSCARSFREDELLWGRRFDQGTDLCPQCRKDLSDGIRAHLYSCRVIPAEMRRQSQEARAAAEKLIQQSDQISGRSGVLMREAELAIAALRDAMKQSASEALRRIIRCKLRDGGLPHDGIPPTIPGRPGDDSACRVCDHVITSRELMMVVTRQPSARQATPVPLHADCFQLWNDERRTFRP